ncbi:putative RTX-family protein [Yersinia mollaretii]|uniref:C80 family cysteine peptidase n=1 Tax=Yersinia mollaretii TaxID=33060 RepID=UPI0005E75A4C|nr:C80 family cysteine peptidase [Yersinia mollaretii]CNK77746.1 putative RTX-family protein [Yersinia mollaretii]
MKNNNNDIKSHNHDISSIAFYRNEKNYRYQDPNNSIDTYIQAPPCTLDDWSKINQNDIISTGNADLDGMNYDYQIIIELSGESEIIRGDQHLASKHPDKTVIMQYDINSGELKTVYGDLAKMQGDNVRWILSSHGRNEVNGKNTLFSDYTPAQLAAGLAKLRVKNTQLINPNRIVLAGCNLGSEGSADHYGLTAARLLWDKGFTASVRAYTEDITISETGERHTYERGHIERRKYKSHRVDYSKKSNQPIMVNGVAAVQLLINDISNDRISFDEAATKYADIIDYYLPYHDKETSLALLKEIVNNDERYVEFNDYVDKTLDGEIPDTVKFTDYILKRGIKDQGKVINSWGIPNSEIIYNSLAKTSDFNYDYQVIVQLSDDDILRGSVELIASKHPDKTLIIQYDVKSQESRIVHGHPDKLQGSHVRWILSGHGDGEQHLLETYSADEIYAGVEFLKKSRNMVSPERVILLACELGINPDDGIQKHFAFEYAELMQKNKDKASLRAYSQEVIIDDNGQRLTHVYDSTEISSKNAQHRVDYRTASDGQLIINDMSIVTYILLDIAAEKITVVEAAEKYKKHLAYYFADSDGEINTKMLSQTANDPLKWQQFNDHITDNQDNIEPQKGNTWFSDGDNRSRSLKKKIHNVVTLNDDISEYFNNVIKLSETSQHKLSSSKDKITSNELALSGNSRLSRITNMLGQGSQMIAFTRLVISTSVMLKKYNSPETTEHEKKEINEALALSWSEFSVNFGIDVMQPYFEKGAIFFAKKIPLTKGVSQIGARAGSLIAKSAGSVLNIASAGFDIYNIVKIYEQLEKETDPDSAKNLIVNGTLSALGAGVGILTAAALAVGFAVAGPLGILAGIGISLATMIYNAVSTIAKIKEQIDLTPWEEFKNGTRLAFGADLEDDISARLEEKQKRIFRDNLDQYAQDIANKRLIPSGVTEYYYAYDKYGEVKKTQYYYIDKNKKEYLLNIINYNDDDFFKFKDEFIHKDTRQIISDDIYRKSWVKCSYKEYEEYRANKNFDVERREDDVFDISGDTHSAIIIDNEYFEDKYSGNIEEKNNILALDKARAEHTGHLMLGSSTNKKVHFNTGVGNSYVFADRHTQNSFDITQGTKTFVGGDLDDMFYLYGHELHETHQPSQLDGRKGEDTLAIMGVNQEGVIGYNINLMAGTVHYHYKETSQLSMNPERVLMNISNIEHLHSAEDTDDILTGNDQVNVLNGMGGRDILRGHGGNDMLSLQSGEAYGGAGSDNYKILQNKQNKSVSVTLFEQPGDEISNIILDYSLQNIDDIYLSGSDICIVLTNENKTLTTLILNNIYSDNQGDKKRNNDFVFYTKDGFILSPQWQTTLINEGSHSDGAFNPTLAAYRFSNKLPTLSGGGNSMRSTFISKKNGVNIIKIDNAHVALKHFIDPMLLGHDFSSDILEGSTQDDIFSHLGAGDEIYVSQGNDGYIIDTMALPENIQHDTLTLSNNGKHDWTTGQEQIFFLNDISGDDLQITLKKLNGVQEAIISHKRLPDDYLKIKLPAPEYSHLLENKFWVVDKDKKCFVVRYNFLEAVISPESLPEITNPRHFTLSNDNYVTWKLDTSADEDFDTVEDEGLAPLIDDADDIDQLINDMGNMDAQKSQHSFLSNFNRHFSSSDLPPIVAAQ